jgi:hypothetical protein
MGVPKFPKLGLSWLWGPITLCANLWLRWCLKKSCSPCQEISNGMSHTTYTQGNQIDSQLLVVGSQTANLTPGLSFGHNLCFQCPNGLCKPILDIYISIAFIDIYIFFQTNGFWPLQLLLEDSGVLRDSNSPSGSCLESVRVHSLTLSCIHGSITCASRVSLLSCTLASPCLGHEPKARVAIIPMH